MSHAATPAAASRPRWRFSFRLSTLFVVITVAAIVCAWPRLDRDIHLYQLRPFVNRDLRKLTEAERTEFERVMKYIHPTAVADSPFSQNWYLWDLQTELGGRLVLFQAQPLLRVPGSAHGQIFVLTKRGDFISWEGFSTGNRIDLVDASVLTNEIPGETLIVAHTQADFRGLDIAKRYYALMDDHPVLIRLEDSQKNLVTDSRALRPIFESVEPPTAADWLRRLTDKRETKLLQVLIEITGGEDSQLDPDIRKNVSKLTKHPHPWVAEMATATLKKLPVGNSE